MGSLKSKIGNLLQGVKNDYNGLEREATSAQVYILVDNDVFNILRLGIPAALRNAAREHILMILSEKRQRL